MYAIQECIDWSDFTQRWVQLRKQCNRTVHWAKLAVAMASADGQAQPWDHYLEIAKAELAKI